MTGNKELSHIVGDTFKYSIKLFDATGKQLIPRKLVFTCVALDLERNFVRKGDEWEVIFSAEETETWKPRVTTYDITAVFSQIVISQTGILFRILKKNNPLIEQGERHG